MTESAHRARSIWNVPPLRYPHSRNIRKGWNSVQLSTPKQVQTQETKQKIYKAASSILKKKGYAYLTVSNICAVAGVSNGTFFYHFKTKDELLVYYNYQKFAEFREKNNFGEAVAGKAFDERILLFYYYWSDYMLDVGLDFCCNYYNTKNTSIDTRRWHQRQPAYVWGYPDSCLQEAAEQGLLKPDYPPDHYGEVVVTIMKGIAFDWCLSGAAFDMHERLDEIMVPYLKSIQTAPPETTGA